MPTTPYEPGTDYPLPAEAVTAIDEEVSMGRVPGSNRDGSPDYASDEPDDKSPESRVRRGAALLDERLPGWADRIDLDRLNMRHCGRCVLGQLHSDFFKGTEAIWPNPDSNSWEAEDRQWDEAVHHGFAWPLNEPDEDAGYHTLRDLWAAEIQARQAGDLTDDEVELLKADIEAGWGKKKRAEMAEEVGVHILRRFTTRASHCDSIVKAFDRLGWSKEGE